MIPLSEVDIQRVKDVRDGKLWDRGCGKTIERMVTLLSYLQPHNDGKEYLFIGENGWHTQDIYRTFFRWVQETGINCQHSHNRLLCHARVPRAP